MLEPLSWLEWVALNDNYCIVDYHIYLQKQEHGHFPMHNLTRGNYKIQSKQINKKLLLV